MTNKQLFMVTGIVMLVYSMLFTLSMSTRIEGVQEIAKLSEVKTSLVIVSLIVFLIQAAVYTIAGIAAMKSKLKLATVMWVCMIALFIFSIYATIRTESFGDGSMLRCLIAVVIYGVFLLPVIKDKSSVTE